MTLVFKINAASFLATSWKQPASMLTINTKSLLKSPFYPDVQLIREGKGNFAGGSYYYNKEKKFSKQLASGA